MKREDIANKLIKKLEMTALLEYHIQIADALAEDIRLDRIGYSRSVTKSLMEKYDTVNWKDAYQKAEKYHRDRFKEIQKEPNVSCGGDFYCAFETPIIDWIDKNLNLSDEPKNSFLEFLYDQEF